MRETGGRGTATGILLAQYYLGEMYATGSGVEQDYETAINWYKQAADGGFNRARGKIINREEEMRIAARHRLKAIRVNPVQPGTGRQAKQDTNGRLPAPVPSPVTASTASPLPVSVFDSLMERQWLRGGRPVDYLPSQVTRCEEDDESLICFSETLKRSSGKKIVEYRVKSIIRHDKSTFTIIYRNLVLDVTDATEPDDQPAGYDEQIDQGFHIQTGWTGQHTVICDEVAGDGLKCVKDRNHQLELVARN